MPRSSSWPRTLGSQPGSRGSNPLRGTKYLSEIARKRENKAVRFITENLHQTNQVHHASHRSVFFIVFDVRGNLAFRCRLEGKIRYIIDSVMHRRLYQSLVFMAAFDIQKQDIPQIKNIQIPYKVGSL